MRRFFTVLLSAICVFIFSSCGGDGNWADEAEQQEVKAFVDELYSVIENKSDISPFIHFDEFLDKGFNAEDYIAMINARNKVSTYRLVKNENYVEKVSDGLYKFYEKTLYDRLQDGFDTRQEARDDYALQNLTSYIKKINGRWYYIGDQERISFSQVVTESDLLLSAGGPDSYPIASISLNSKSLHSPVNFVFKNFGWSLTLPNEKSYEGQTFTINVSYADGTTTSRAYVIPRWIERDFKINAVNKNSDGTVTVNYSLPTNNIWRRGIETFEYLASYIRGGTHL